MYIQQTEYIGSCEWLTVSYKEATTLFGLGEKHLCLESCDPLVEEHPRHLGMDLSQLAVWGTPEMIKQGFKWYSLYSWDTQINAILFIAFIKAILLLMLCKQGSLFDLNINQPFKPSILFLFDCEIMLKSISETNQY